MTAFLCIGITILCFGGFILANCLKGHESCRPVVKTNPRPFAGMLTLFDN